MQPEPQQIRLAAYKLVLFQCVVAALAAVYFALTSDALAALSAIKGGIIAAVTNLVFALIAFSKFALSNAQQAKMALVKGHLFKLILTIVLFVIVLKQEVAASAFIIGFSLATMAQWAAAVFFKH
ncbi:ATP synthase subunit I [Alishewanella sp. d11]|uniref:ATP synthase subunit I n=1 Tax=Alishewanella sp. d11 TaxID=3414030 RepID=UPI003BF8D6DB